MKTRTLLLLALGCGLAIMLAGAVFLFQLVNQDDPVEAVPVGETVAVGDMSVTVVGAEERDGLLTVAVLLGGVEDPDGGAEFRLIASARAVAAELPIAGDCSSTGTEVQECTVRFDVSEADGTSRVLFYERGEERARWVLG